MTVTGKMLEFEGVHKTDGPSSKELSNLPPIQRVQSAERLSALSGDFIFFNHGLLFTEAGMSHDPVEEFMLKKDDYEAVFAVEYDRPLFKGLKFPGDDTWNRVLLGCKRELWPDLYFLLNTLIAVSSVSKKIYSCFLSNVYIPDPNLWDGTLAGFKVDPKAWGDLCEKSDRGMSGDSRYTDVIFPDYPQSLKIFVAGVSGPSRLAYMRSGIRPYVAYDVAEQETLNLQEVIKSHVD
jgi:hypothetical protein